MNYRDRFRACLRHEQTDRVPFDLAGTSLTAIEFPETVDQLRALLGLTAAYDGWYQKFDERILEYLDIDIRRVGDILEPASENARPLQNHEYTDCWGVSRIFTGQYWDIKKHPLKGAAIDDLDRFPWPDPQRIDPQTIDAYREQARKLHDETPYVVCGEHPVYGVFELGCWMCGFDDFLLKTALDPDFIHRFSEIILDYQKKIIEIYYGAIGEYIHFTTSGDDFGTQTGPFISPGMFAELVLPYFQERISYTKKFTRAAYFHHTCGSVFSLIPHLITAGVDILNPIQPSARDMEPEKLKKAYGDQITFYGGIDTQYVLPYGSAEAVHRAVTQVLTAMAGDGGYILAPAHNIQSDVPAENIVAIYKAAKDFFNQ